MLISNDPSQEQKQKLNMEVEIISKNCIAPSSPTPSHLKTYKISLIDQFQAFVYVPTILFYPNNQESTNLSERSHSQLLKNSLSKTLSRFYPLAGRIKDNLSIDCNDEGVSYVQAKANIPLSQCLDNKASPDLTLLHKLMPSATVLHDVGSHVALMQQTTFCCGGFAIGVHVSHLVLDGTSLASFLKDWAATTCNSAKQILFPFLDGSSIFPQYNPFPSEASSYVFLHSFLQKGNHATRRFVFNESIVASLKAKANNSSLKNPTRVEVVTAFLSKCIMSAFKNKKGIDTSLAVNHVVNLRRRAVPPLPECSVGNFIWFGAALFTPNKENELSGYACQLREAIQKVDNDFLKKIQSEGGFFKLYESGNEMGELFGTGGAVEYVLFSSWCTLGLYDIDFGWGKPIWATCYISPGNSGTEIPQINVIYLMDRRTENGIEAWVSMKEDVIAFLEKDKELLQYATIDPSPLE